MKLQFGKKCHTLLCILALLRIAVAWLSLKYAWLPPIFFLDFNSPCKDLLFQHSHEPRKNTSVLVDTVVNDRYIYFESVIQAYSVYIYLFFFSFSDYPWVTDRQNSATMTHIGLHFHHGVVSKIFPKITQYRCNFCYHEHRLTLSSRWHRYLKLKLRFLDKISRISMCDNLPLATTYPKHQIFPKQSRIVGTSHKRPRPLFDYNLSLSLTSSKRPLDT